MIINTSKSSHRHHTPDQISSKRSSQNHTQKIIQKKIINNNNNINPDIDISYSYSNIDQNDINLLNQKIISQQNNISYLRSRLQNYDNTKNEISRLNQELKKLEEAIKSKNAIISEFQNLSELTKQKFENYIKKTDNQIQEYNKKFQNTPELQKENYNLSQKLIVLQEENKNLRNKYTEIELKNKNEVDSIQNDINILKEKCEEIIKENNAVKCENNNYNKEIENLKNKLLVQEKYEIELEEIKKKYFLLENQINQKENNIINLQKINEVLEKKLNSSNENYRKILIEQDNLKEKLKQVENICRQYEVAFQRMKNNNNNNNININNLLPRMNVEEISNNFNNDYISPNTTQNRYKNTNRIFYKHNNDEKLNLNDNNLMNVFNDNSLKFYNYNEYNSHLNRNKGNKRFKSYKKNNYKENLTLKNKDYNLFFNRNKKNDLNKNFIKNNSEYITQSDKLLDKSFGYSNYLLDNLKNKISRIHFDNKY